MALLSLFLLVLAASPVAAQYSAIANIWGTTNEPTVRGRVLFTQTNPSGSVTVNVLLNGISSDGDRAIQINTWGDISGTDGAATGQIFNPTAATYACPSGPRPYGNLGNFNVVGGVINTTVSLDLLTLSGVNSIIGRSIVLRSLADDCTTTSPGTVAAQGVIAIDQDSIANTTAPITRGTCFFNSLQFSGVSGQLWISDDAAVGFPLGSNISGYFDGLNGTQRAFHIHKWGDISSLANTGTHYDPWASPKHGIPPYAVRHVGDLGNIYHFIADRAYYLYIRNDLLFLANSSTVVGRAAVIHTDPDFCTNFWGGRLAGCVIGIADPSTFASPVPSTIPTTQNSLQCVDTTTTGTTTTTSSTTGDIGSAVSVSISYLLAAVAALAVVILA